MCILSNAALQVPQVINNTIHAHTANKPLQIQVVTLFCKELSNLGDLKFVGSEMYFRMVRSGVISTFLGVVEKFRILLCENALYHFPDKIDRSTGTTCFYILLFLTL